MTAKRNPNRKQYGLSRLPVDRKQAYLQETATHQDQTIHSTASDQCEVEYDSDEDNDNINVPKTASTNAVETKTIDTSNSNDDRLGIKATTIDACNNNDGSIHKEAKKLAGDDNSIEKPNATGKDKLPVDSGAQPTDHDNATKDNNSKDVVSPKRTKMIGPSLGPLRKRRRRSSEVRMYVYTYMNTVYVYMQICVYTNEKDFS